MELIGCIQSKQDMEMAARKAATGTVGDVPDISQFLDDNKGRVDRDPDCLAYDDLRHYAYEGDGNSGRSLSSLISGDWLIHPINPHKTLFFRHLQYLGLEN